MPAAGPVTSDPVKETTMTTVEYHDLARPAARSALEGVAAAMLAAVDAVRRYVRMRRALAELRGLDDRMLKDIGLSRSTLHAAALEVHGFAGIGHGGR